MERREVHAGQSLLKCQTAEWVEQQRTGQTVTIWVKKRLTKSAGNPVNSQAESAQDNFLHRRIQAKPGKISFLLEIRVRKNTCRRKDYYKPEPKMSCSKRVIRLGRVNTREGGRID